MQWHIRASVEKENQGCVPTHCKARWGWAREPEDGTQDRPALTRCRLEADVGLAPSCRCKADGPDPLGALRASARRLEGGLRARCWSSSSRIFALDAASSASSEVMMRSLASQVELYVNADGVGGGERAAADCASAKHRAQASVRGKSCSAPTTSACKTKATAQSVSRRSIG